MGEMFHYREWLTLAISESYMLFDVPVVKKSIQFYQVFSFLDCVAKCPVVMYNWKACLQSYPVHLCTSSILETPRRKMHKNINGCGEKVDMICEKSSQNGCKEMEQSLSNNKGDKRKE